MLHTRFHPAVDAVDLPPDLVGIKGEKRIRDNLKGITDEVLALLRQDFSGMVDYYRLPSQLPLWINDSTGAGWMSTAQAVAALDFFSTRSLRRKTKGAAWREFLRERLIHIVGASTGRLCHWLSVLHGIPDNWLPENIVRRSLHEQVSGDGRFILLNLELVLRLPHPGGGQWLCQSTFREWQRVRGCLSAGHPCLLEFVGMDAVPDFLKRETVVVFAAEELGDKQVLLKVYQPSRNSDSSLLCDFSGPGFVVRENDKNGQSLAFGGFFMVDYRPHKPPQSFGHRLLEITGGPRLLWGWRHRRGARQ